MIEGQNRLYQVFDKPDFQGFDRTVVDRLKRSFYDSLDALNRLEDIANFKASTRDLVEGLFPTAPAPADAEDLKLYARQFVERRRKDIDLLMDHLAAEFDLDSSTNDIDMLLASTDPQQWHRDARREVFVNYLGFSFWDILTLPLMTWREASEFNEILIDRMSPRDANTLAQFSGSDCLKGVGFAHFAAFFSRAYRENDYLLGRIHALDRLIDIVCNSARLEMNGERNAILALKKRGFMQILDAEEKHLQNSAALIAALRVCVIGLDASAS
jgi:hypothetical protein